MFVLRAIVLSLVLHILLWGGLVMVPPSWVMDRPNLPMEVTIVERPMDTSKSTQVVRDSEVPEKLKDDTSKEPARFMSAQQRRVLLESRARTTGLTRNGQTLPPNSWLNAERPQKPPEQSARKSNDMDGYEPIPLPKPQDNLSRFFEDAPSTVGEQLPDDISLGQFTALNTDRFKYYSFYSRIEELIRFRWEKELADAIDHFDQKYLSSVVGKRNWVTKVEFWLKADGHFHSAHIHQESGIKRFDLAAVTAFRDARYFPNPPREMVDEDGLIRIQYAFNVRWSPSAVVHR
jgi:TonB family protein